MRFRRAIAATPGSMVAGTVGTVTAHGLLIALLALGLSHGSSPQPTVYAVELVAAPLPTSTQRAAPAATPTPPAPPKVDPAPKAPPRKTAPVPKAKPPTKVDPKTEPAPTTATPNRPVPGATPSTGTDVDNVRVAGLQFPYPDYLRNIMNQVLKRWARPVGTAALEAEISFTIQRDGSVRDIKVVRTSKSFPFDLEAQGAVEQAAADKAFGPLPQAWPSDILQVAFLFTPRNRT